MTTFKPPSVRTFAAGPPPAPEPIMQTSYTLGDRVTWDISKSPTSRIHRSRLCYLVLQKAYPVKRNGLGSALDVSPNRRSRAQFREGESKAFNGQPAIIVEGTQRLKYLLPFHVPRTRDATIVFTGMNVFEVRPDRTVTRSDILLFDVGMEGVEQNPDIGVANFLCQLGCIRGSVQEKCFEPVQGFDGEGHVVGSKRFSHGLKALDGPLPFIAGSTPPGQITNRAVERSGNNFRACFCCGLGYVPEVLVGPFADIRTIADQAE